MGGRAIMTINRNRQQGFTLIELAIVLVIVAVLLGSFIGTLTSRVENARITETKTELELIKRHLIGFAYTNHYLPCSDCIDSPCAGGSTELDGIEDRDGSTCSVPNKAATLPWVTLGLGREDAWATRYRYWVDPVYALGGGGFTLDSADGDGLIEEPDYVTDPTGATSKPLAERVVAVIYSHGKNTYGGISSGNVELPALPAANVDEKENTDNDAVFHSRPPTAAAATTAGGEFDDIVIWLTEYELKAKMVEAGVLP